MRAAAAKWPVLDARQMERGAAMMLRFRIRIVDRATESELAQRRFGQQQNGQD